MFGAVSLTKHVDIDQYKYFGYGVGFLREGEFSFGSNGFSTNVIILGANMSSSVQANNKKIKLYSIDFTENNKKVCLSLHYNGDNSYLFVNGTEIYKFKAKDSEILATPLCLGNISKDFTLDSMKKTGLNGYVYDFNIDYDAIAVDDILGIHKYLMKKKTI